MNLMYGITKWMSRLLTLGIVLVLVISEKLLMDKTLLVIIVLTCLFVGTATYYILGILKLTRPYNIYDEAADIINEPDKFLREFDDGWRKDYE